MDTSPGPRFLVNSVLLIILLILIAWILTRVTRADNQAVAAFAIAIAGLIAVLIRKYDAQYERYLAHLIMTIVLGGANVLALGVLVLTFIVIRPLSVIAETPTSSPSSTATAPLTTTAIPTLEPTSTVTPMPTLTETATPTFTPTNMPTATYTSTATLTETPTATSTATMTATSTATPTNFLAVTAFSPSTEEPTNSPMPTETPTLNPVESTSMLFCLYIEPIDIPGFQPYSIVFRNTPVVGLSFPTALQAQVTLVGNQVEMEIYNQANFTSQGTVHSEALNGTSSVIGTCSNLNINFATRPITIYPDDMIVISSNWVGDVQTSLVGGVEINISRSLLPVQILQIGNDNLEIQFPFIQSQTSIQIDANDGVTSLLFGNSNLAIQSNDRSIEYIYQPSEFVRILLTQ